MKKLFLTLSACFMAMAANAALYVVGADFGNQDPNNAVELTVADGYYTYTTGGWSKISTQRGGWDDVFNPNCLNATTKASRVQTQTLKLGAGSENMPLPYAATFTYKIKADLSEVTVTGDVPPEGFEKVYLRGDKYGWNTFNSTTEFTTTDGVTYVLKGVAMNAGQAFKIADASWGAINYGGATGIKLGTPVTLQNNNQTNCTLSVAVSDATFTFNLNSGQLTVTDASTGPVYPDNIYIIGDYQGGGWNPTVGLKMNNDGDGSYSASNVVIVGSSGTAFGYFALTAALGTSDSDWDTLNGNRFGPSVQDTEVVMGENQVDGYGDVSWKIPAGTYNFAFNYVDMTLDIEKVGGGDDPTPTPGDADAIYVVGDGTGLSWDLPGMKVEKNDAGNFEFTVENLNKFKFSTVNASTWDDFDSGCYGPGTAEFGDAVANAGGETLPILSWATDIMMPWIGNYTVTVKGNLTEMTVYTGEKGEVNKDLYIRGAMNDWTATDQWKFSYNESTGVYTFVCKNATELKEGVEFKFADANWGKLNFTSNDLYMEASKEGEEVYLSKSVGENDNMAMAADFVGTITVVLDNEGGVATFKSESSDGVGVIEAADAAEAVYYNLQGVRVANPYKGVYIRVAAGQATKVVK